MFRYVKNKDIDYKLWDECIDNSENGIIYALSWYLDITAPGWDGIVKEEGGTYKVVMPIPVFKKFGIKYIKQPVLCQQLGIFGIAPSEESKVLEEIEGLLKKNFKYIQRYEFNTENTALLQRGLKSFQNHHFHTYHLDLRNTYKEIYKNYKKDRRWRINKARKANIRISESDDIEALIKIFNKNVAPKIYGIVGNRYEYQILKNLFYATKERGLCRMLAAKTTSGKLLAIGLFFLYNQKIIYIFNASTSKGKSLSAISLVVDKMLQEYSGETYCFDFESPEIPDVAEFYRRFGSVATPFLSISRNDLPFLIKAIKKLRFKIYRTFIDAPPDTPR